MNILFDINHPADINFFKNAIDRLHNLGHTIIITYRDRGRLVNILEFELNDYCINRIGSHKRGFFKKIYSQLARDFSLIPFLRKNKIDLVACFGATSALASRFLGIPFLAFDDDFEYKIAFFHANFLATKHIYPDFIDYNSKRTVKYRGFKELAYLHPEKFISNPKILSNYDLKPNEYVFIREIANVSLNYKEKTSILENLVNIINARELKIVLSLEDKNLVKNYVNDCIILEEPISDIYSLISYSLFAISSGDTVARESALLGVPTIYTGGRAMKVHEELVKNKLMYEITDIKEIEELISQLTINKKSMGRQSVNKLIVDKWEDTTSVILKNINELIK